MDRIRSLCCEFVVTQIQGPYAPVKPEELSKRLLHVWGVFEAVVADIQGAEGTVSLEAREDTAEYSC